VVANYNKLGKFGCGMTLRAQKREQRAKWGGAKNHVVYKNH